MSAQNGNTTPPRTGMRRLILPIEYRHLSIWGACALAVASS